VFKLTCNKPVHRVGGESTSVIPDKECRWGLRGSLSQLRAPQCKVALDGARGGPSDRHHTFFISFAHNMHEPFSTVESIKEKPTQL
jgi:hypothetical protein